MSICWKGRLTRPLSATGFIIGIALLAASLTPSLLPRSYVLQGVLCGTSFAFGYMIGVFLHWTWRYLGLAELSYKHRKNVRIFIGIAGILIVAAFLWQTTNWQNSIRSLMDMEPVESEHPWRIALIAIVVSAVLLVIGRVFHLVSALITLQSRRFLPRRVASILAISLAFILSWTIVSGVIFQGAIRFMDSSLKRVDALIEPDISRPNLPFQTGSEASLIPWESLGNRGREFISNTLTAAEIERITGEPAMEPLRVYAGLNTAETANERAQKALEELIRVKAFDRSTLVIITPTGTGWIDPEGIDSLELLHHGDVATVALQYSYLSSALALLTDPEYGVESAHALFETVYQYWTKLPKDHRPKLYLYGLSLGALNGQKSNDLYDVLADPYDGALWAGPPFASPTWKMITAGRNEGSPVWLPEFRDSSIIRFANQTHSAHRTDVPWGPMRIIYLQHASDPIVFFQPSILYQRPEWLQEPRGSDVSPSLRWFPGATFLQVAVDVLNATEAPLGYGHVYAGEHYVDAWREVTDPQGWTEEGLDNLRQYFIDRRK